MKRTVCILVIAILVLLIVMQFSGLLIRIHHDRHCCFTIEQSKTAQLFVNELDVASLGLESAWIERQCDYYSVGIFVFDLFSWKRTRNDFALVIHRQGSDNQSWPKYNNDNLQINYNSSYVFRRFRTIEEIDVSKISVGPVK